MTKTTFNLGDKVQLNSGGAVMTVISVEDGHVECSWHDQQDKPWDKTYPAAALKFAKTAAAARDDSDADFGRTGPGADIGNSSPGADLGRNRPGADIGGKKPRRRSDL